MKFTAAELSSYKGQSSAVEHSSELLSWDIDNTDPAEKWAEDDSVQILGYSDAYVEGTSGSIAYLDDDGDLAMLIDLDYDGIPDEVLEFGDDAMVEILEVLPEYPEYEDIDLADELGELDLVDYDDSHDDF